MIKGMIISISLIKHDYIYIYFSESLKKKYWKKIHSAGEK